MAYRRRYAPAVPAIVGTVIVVALRPDGLSWEVRTPYNRAAIPAWHTIPGAYWSRASQARVVPVNDANRHALDALLRTYFPGYTVHGTHGVKVLDSYAPRHEPVPVYATNYHYYATRYGYVF